MAAQQVVPPTKCIQLCGEYTNLTWRPRGCATKRFITRCAATVFVRYSPTSPSKLREKKNPSNIILYNCFKNVPTDAMMGLYFLKQQVVLGYHCMSTEGELAEAVLAIAGVPAQHNAPDRDYYILIKEENIIPGKDHNNNNNI